MMIKNIVKKVWSFLLKKNSKKVKNKYLAKKIFWSFFLLFLF